MRIVDLAKAICPECELKPVGIRPGEKLHEIMISSDDARSTVEYEDHYVVKPAFRYFSRRFCDNGCKPVPEGFNYSSDSNTWWLGIEELREIIAKLQQDDERQ